MIFTQSPITRDRLRAAINTYYRIDESVYVDFLLKEAALPEEALQRIEQLARNLVIEIRKDRVHKSSLDAFLFQYNLSSEEGVALMCLAEALLRTPDSHTKDQLIEDKVTSVDWSAHAGKSESFFVNAATWSLMLTGKVLSTTPNQSKWEKIFKDLTKTTSEPVIRAAVTHAIKILSHQFVMGEDIHEALKRAHYNEERGYAYSYDMLGEAARTEADAERYFKAYQNAIKEVGKAAQKHDSFFKKPTISIKLSALHPRYENSQRERVLPAMIARVRELALQAQAVNIGITIDAEEADRLEFSLDVIAAILTDPAFANWQGFGMAIQAYQKRAMAVIDWVVEMARTQNRRVNLRLVKGAYWDYEIKDSQMKGLQGYPVFTRKANTDVSYIACAKKMISAMDIIYPQFGTHNAHTVATILELMGSRRDYEFQCLHGMGTALYDQLIKSVHCRVYAPVGNQNDLLGYLVRRLLENGANNSFVNRIVDEKAPIKELIAHPALVASEYEQKSHPRIPLPVNLYGEQRRNSMGVDLSDPDLLITLDKSLQAAAEKTWLAIPLIGEKKPSLNNPKPVTNPGDRRQVVGHVIEATMEDVQTALTRAQAAAERWDAVPVIERATILERAAQLFEERMPEFMLMAMLEAGKTLADAVGEVREAVDYCRYYAAQAKTHLMPQQLPGPTGEFNQLQAHGRGVIVCISPWNFPLAIFMGQITAALVAGNTVIAKPAEQTPLIAAKAVQLLYEAGVPDDVLQFLPGQGEIVGAALVADQRTQGIIFTGSTETARAINQTLAQRSGPIIPLIAETGGQNAMIVDSTALLEQVVGDVLASAFNSAGQRCSALRVLFVQEEIADKLIHMLQGAMAELQVGDPSLLKTDIGPVIDEDARQMLQAHVEYLKDKAKLIYAVALPQQTNNGTFFAPCAYEIANANVLKREVFGPILHVIRYKEKDLDKVIAAINATGYGLTFGIHTRIDEKAIYLQQRVHAGNTYVNRNMIGAVVGVQPFGGESLSGTGPKAGGPHYLQRLIKERTLTVNTTAAGGNASLLTLGE